MRQWTAVFENPFAAIREAANAAGKPQDFQKALFELSKVPAWTLFDSKGFLDDVLQEISGATNIVCEHVRDGHTTRYRAAYDE
jgi:hypothetical protein